MAHQVYSPPFLITPFLHQNVADFFTFLLRIAQPRLINTMPWFSVVSKNLLALQRNLLQLFMLRPKNHKQFLICTEKTNIISFYSLSEAV